MQQQQQQDEQLNTWPDQTNEWHGLQYWPESGEFSLANPPGGGLHAELLPGSNLAPQTHNRGVEAPSGTSADPYVGSLPTGAVDRAAKFQVSYRDTEAHQPQSQRTLLILHPVCLCDRLQDASFLSTANLAGAATAVPAQMLPAGPSAGLPGDSYTSSYGTNAAGGSAGAAPLMYPSFQLPGAKPEGEHVKHAVQQQECAATSA
jgi:hypothetical protein